MRVPGPVLLLLLCACASAGSGNDDVSPDPPDASGALSFPDANLTLPDAAPPVDARPVVPDAMTRSGADAGLICNDSSTCTDPGTCCFSLGGPGFCVPGTEAIPGVCIPE